MKRTAIEKIVLSTLCMGSMDITSWKDLLKTAVDKVIAEDIQCDDIGRVKGFQY